MVVSNGQDSKGFNNIIEKWRSDLGSSEEQSDEESLFRPMLALLGAFSEDGEVSQQNVETLLGILEECLTLYRGDDKAAFGNKMVEYGILFGLYQTSAYRAKSGRKSKHQKDTPFIAYVVNRASSLWAEDIEKVFILKHMADFLAIEVNGILDSFNKAILIGKPELNWLLKYKETAVSGQVIISWLKKHYDKIPDYAVGKKDGKSIGGNPGKKILKLQRARVKLAHSYKYFITEGGGELFEKRLPFDLKPPSYD